MCACARCGAMTSARCARTLSPAGGHTVRVRKEAGGRARFAHGNDRGAGPRRGRRPRRARAPRTSPRALRPPPELRKLTPGAGTRRPGPGPLAALRRPREALLLAGRLGSTGSARPAGHGRAGSRRRAVRFPHVRSSRRPPLAGAGGGSSSRCSWAAAALRPEVSDWGPSGAARARGGRAFKATGAALGPQP